ncbi:hypothetical protein M513_10542 [Trichuris suis]|uniref:Uncharacterized protein n=1 Tax=Trichuris suis TaxID=68888 RepID=A0A085LUG2_9BILA|nr:hypothetical protein M513_10542 [Trichuris suis]
MQREKCNKCSNIRPAPPSQIASFGFNKASVQCHVSGFNNRVLGQSQVNDCKRGLGEVPVLVQEVDLRVAYVSGFCKTSKDIYIVLICYVGRAHRVFPTNSMGGPGSQGGPWEGLEDNAPGDCPNQQFCGNK